MSHSCSNSGRGCRQNCFEPEGEVEPKQRPSVRFFIIVGVITSLAICLLAAFTILYPGAMLPALAAFMWVLGARLLGKNPFGEGP